jgi:hypothetical protein
MVKGFLVEEKDASSNLAWFDVAKPNLFSTVSNKLMLITIFYTTTIYITNSLSRLSLLTGRALHSLRLDLFCLVSLLKELLNITIYCIRWVFTFNKLALYNLAVDIRQSRDIIQILFFVIPMSYTVFLFIWLPTRIDLLYDPLVLMSTNDPNINNSLSQPGGMPGNSPNNNGRNPMNIDFMINRNDEDNDNRTPQTSINQTPQTLINPNPQPWINQVPDSELHYDSVEFYRHYNRPLELDNREIILDRELRRDISSISYRHSTLIIEGTLSMKGQVIVQLVY